VDPGPHVRGRQVRARLLRLAHTAELDAATLAAVRALLVDAFEDGLSAEDFDHALGGMHALAWEGDVLIGHAALVQRRLPHGGRALRAGYVEGVAVRADHRRPGRGAALMDALEPVLRGGYELGALSATEAGARLYVRRGWRRWEGRTWALTPDGVVRTAGDDGGIYVLPVGAPLDLAGDLTADWRDGDPW
jgi:aminoglycoside 2'-N-acetyltransferase I